MSEALIEEVRRLEATDPKTVSEANLRFMRYAIAAPKLADALEATTAALREERINAEGLRERLAEAEAQIGRLRTSLDRMLSGKRVEITEPGR